MTTVSAPTQDELEAAIGKRVHDLIWDRRTTNVAVARAIGITSSVMSKKLRGESAWSARQVKRAAAYLGVTAGYLYGETGRPVPSEGTGRVIGLPTDPNVNFGWSKQHPSGSTDVMSFKRVA